MSIQIAVAANTFIITVDEVVTLTKNRDDIYCRVSPDDSTIVEIWETSPQESTRNIIWSDVYTEFTTPSGASASAVCTGINTILRTNQTIAALLADGTYSEIVVSSSGTVMTLLASINKAITGVWSFVYDKLRLYNATSTFYHAFRSLATGNRTVTFQDADYTAIGKDTTDILTNKTFDGAGTGNAVSNMLSVSAEQSSTPVTDDAENVGSIANQKRYMFFTIPSTYKFVVVTGIEWKNGTAVNGNVTAGVDIVDATTPVSASTLHSAICAQVAQSGTNAVQRVSMVASHMIPAGAIVGVWIHTDGTGKYRRESGLGAANTFKSITYTVAPPSQDVTAWTTSTVRDYIKLYYKGYS